MARFFDSHVHSHASPDSDMPPEAAAAALQARGLGVIFTEHVDYATPAHGFDPAAADKPRGRDFITDWDLYPAAYEPLHAGGALLGLEIGLTAYYQPLNRQTAESYDYDFILGSVHAVDGYDLYYDSQNTFDYDRRRRMLAYSLEMAEINDFIDAFGHVDYLSRYTPLPDKNLYYADFAEDYDRLFKALARRDTALEINTQRFGQPGAEGNWARLCAAFRAQGGRFVTLGSDAHDTAGLARGFDRALAMAREAGLTPVFFKQRKRYACDTFLP